MKKTFFYALVLSVVLWACGGQNKNTESANLQDTMEWAGTYFGTVPCADCPGIDVELTLNSDLTYSMTLVYQDREGTFAHSGAFEWNDDETLITLQNLTSGEGLQNYKYENGMLVLLTLTGETVTGELADAYLLHKTEE